MKIAEIKDELKTKVYSFQYYTRQWIIGKTCKSKKIEIDIKTFSPKKVLFILTGLLGDSVMSIPTIIQAKKIWKDSHFTLLGQKHNIELVENCPYIDFFYETPVMPFSISKRAKEKQLLDWLRKQNFDIAIMLLGIQFSKILYDAQIPIRVGDNGFPLANCLTHSFDVKTPREWAINERLNSLRCLGYDVSYSLPKLWVKEESTNLVRRKLFELGLKKEKYFVLHPFGSTSRQWWNLAAINEFTQGLFRVYGLQTILIGKEEVDILSDPSIINTTGKLSLRELISIIKNAEVIITTDSGPFHIAGALNTKTLGLFRNKRPEHSNHYPNAQVVFGKDELCDLKCEWANCKFNPCKQMKDINHKLVIEHIQRIMD